MKRQFIIFLTSLQFFTRIPVPQTFEFTTENLNRASRYFPLVGIIVGAFSALVYWVSSLVFPQAVALILSMIASLLVTGGFHEDGLADTCDGFGGGWTGEDILSIMKDSRLGTFGALGLFSVLLLKFLSLSEIDHELIPAVLVVGHSVSRFFSTIVIALSSYVYWRDSARAKPLAETITPVEVVLSGIFGLGPLLFLPNYYVLSLLPLMAVLLIMNRMFNKRLGGFTGDCLGSVQQITEALFYVYGALLLWNYT